MRERPLVAPAFALAAGILCGHSVPPGAAVAAGAAGVLLLAFVAHGCARRGETPAAWRALTAALLCAGLARIGFARLPDPRDFGHWPLTPGPATLDGVVTRTPERFGGGGAADGAAPGSWLVVQVAGVDAAGARFPARGGVRVVCGDGVPEVREGDRVRLSGWLAAPRAPGNPGEFDFAAHLARQGIRRTLRVTRAASVTCLSPGGGPLAWRGAARERVGRAFDAIGPEGRLYRALVLGDRSGLDSELERAFVTSGTAHVLAVSGLNLVLAMAMAGGLARLLGAGFRTSSLLAAAVALAYAALVGWSPPVVRAAAMGATFAGGRVLLRHGDPLNSLAAAALLDLAILPEDLISAGFHLSFAAVAALVVGARPLTLLLAPSAAPGLLARARRTLAASLAASTAAGLATAPLTLAHFNIVAPISLLANLVVVPLAAALLALGVLAAALGSLDPAVVQALAPAFAAPVNLGETLILALGACPGGHLWLPSPPAAWTIGAVASLALLAWRPRLGAAGIALAAATLPAWLAIPHDRSFRFTFLDVGQGACAVAEFPDGDVWVFDCGCTGRSDAGERVAAPFLWDRRRRRIDTLLLTHADADHISGAVTLLRRFCVGRLVVPQALLVDPRAADVLAAARDIPVVPVAAGQTLRTRSGIPVRVLAPPAETPRWSSNDTSVVCLVACEGWRILLTGDAEARSIRSFLGEVPRVDVLQVPHHGGASSRSLALPGRAQPGIAVVSAREWFMAPDVEEDYRALGVEVEETWRRGAIGVEGGAGGRRVWWGRE